MPSLSQEVSIPKISESLFFAVLPKDLRDHLMGDLYEEFHNEIAPRYGAEKARWWYRRQVLKSTRFYILKRKGDIMFFLFSIIVFVALSISAAILGGTLSIFINIPSLIVVIIPSFIFAIAATSVRAWALGLKLLLIDQDYQKQKEIMEASRFFKVFGNISLILGIFYTLFSAMQMLNSFKFPGTTADIIIRASMVCILTLLYGIAIKCILYAADQRLCNRYLS